MNTGTLSRAPVAMQKVGLEWLWRLVQQPRRLAKRYLLQDLPWLLGMVPVAIRERMGRSGADATGTPIGKSAPHRRTTR
ncbi:MAG: WecB/TagA/CpsF family glycosyltransferase [Propionibacteriaceae bacterium]|nr:WecB/TagA/CpsF family glycosyltransferase [Propionibacteriaceae bacterium]